MKLIVDGKQVEVEGGATILDAARKLGIDVPTLCNAEGLEPSGGCWLCVVRVEGRQNLIPSCAARAEDGMRVTTDSTEICAARVAALELLLSDHTGDCEAPCTQACPAGLDIPEMIHCVKQGDLKRARELLREKIPLARITGRECPAYCERVCRRGIFDDPIAIRSLERFVADSQPAGEVVRKAPTGKKVAVIGAGAAGMSAAFCLAREGHCCEVFDSSAAPGGMLRTVAGLSAALDAEIADLAALGCRFNMNRRLGDNLDFDKLGKSYDAILIACGAPVGSGNARIAEIRLFQELGLNVSARGISINATSMTNLKGVFAAGEVVSGPTSAVRTIAAGRDAASAMDAFVRGKATTPETRPINVKMGKLSESTKSVLFRNLVRSGRAILSEPDAPISPADAQREAERCIQCQCLGKEKCALRSYATRYGAKVSAFSGERRPFERDESHPRVIYESGKCILCGLCVRTATAAKAPLGINFEGRGFAAKVGVPFGETIGKGLGDLAERCAAICPTGALALKR